MEEDESVLQEAERAAEASEAAGAHGAAGAEVGMPQLDPSIYPNLIFWLLVAIGLLYLILTRIAIPRISDTLAERNDAITNDIEQAQIYKRRAEEAEAAYNAALAKAREEAHAISAETKAQINKELATLMAKADAEIAAKAAESEQRIAEIRESAAQSVEAVARDTTGDIIGLFLPGASDAAAVDAAITGRLKR